MIGQFNIASKNIVNQNPLMPTKPSRARRWIQTGKATPFWSNGVFCVRLNVDPSGTEGQDICVGVDSGSKKEGFTVKSESHTYLNVQADAHDKVSKKIEKRRELRRSRRSQKCPNRKNRMNRLANKERLPAGTRARWDWKLRVLDWLSKLFPITHVCVEDIKARTIKRAKRWNASFSPLQVGKDWFYAEVRKRWQLLTLQGFETKQIRDRLSLKKSSKKLAETFDAHCVDSWCLAYHTVGGPAIVHNTDMFCISPIPIARRNLHREQPKKVVSVVDMVALCYSRIQKYVYTLRWHLTGHLCRGWVTQPLHSLQRVQIIMTSTINKGLVKNTLIKHIKYGLTRVAGINVKGLYSIYSLEGKRLTTSAKRESFRTLTKLNFQYRSGVSSLC